MEHKLRARTRLFMKNGERIFFTKNNKFKSQLFIRHTAISTT